MAESAPAWFFACGLPQAWRGQDHWRLLDTAFGDGSMLLALWQTWAQDAQAPRALHVVAICPVAPSRDALLDQIAVVPALRDRAHELERQWFGFLPGFHRIELHGGRLRLILCVGPQHAMLREQQFEADSVFLREQPTPVRSDGSTSPRHWDKHQIKAVTRLCRRGTGVAIDSDLGIPSELLSQAGMALTHTQTSDAIVQAWQYQPRWTITSTRSTWRRDAASASDCVVIGAGLAGAAMAYALAQRGWQVTVLDAAATPASGASALPAGLLVPLVSRDDNIRSRLARAGIRMGLHAASQLLVHGVDWAWTGVAELDRQWRDALPDPWPETGQQWSQTSLAHAPAHPARVGSGTADNGIWHASAGWIKPARLVLACLAHPAIRFVGGQPIDAITHRLGHWQALDKAGAVLAQAPQMVLANAGDAARLVAQLPSKQALRLPLSPVHGQVSWASHKPGDATLFPPFAVNGAGSAIAHVPQSQASAAWFVGATYESASEIRSDPQAAHAENLDRLAQLLPDAAAHLATDFSDGTVRAWRGTRWTTPDRLPVAGAVSAATQPGLWISAAMGSRALTYAILCAEVVAAQLSAEPSPVEARLLQCLDPRRFASNEL